MIGDEKLAVDESRRLALHEAVKDRIGADVQAEIVDKADVVTPADSVRADDLAGEMKDNAYSEVAATSAELGQTRVAARVSQVVDYVFFLIYGLIGLEIILSLLGARDSAGFKRLIDTVSAPILAPFEGLMRDVSTGPFRLMLSYIMALVAYLLLHLAVTGLLRLFAHRKVAV